MTSNQEYNESNCDICQTDEWKTSCDKCNKCVCFKCVKQCECPNELDICDDCKVCDTCDTRTNDIHPFFEKKLFYNSKYKTYRIYPTNNDMVHYELESKNKMTSFQDYVNNECKSMKFVLKGMGCDENKIEAVIESMKAAYETANFIA